METSEPGNSISFNVRVWFNKEHGQIHIASTDVSLFKGMHSTISNDPNSERYHPNLFKKLAKCLQEGGAPHPEPE
jgi:hypothetical protein